jgi:hypothetical protein
MRSWLKVIFDTIKVFILFTACTILFYYGLVWINQEYQNYHKYDEPEGSAVKVSTAEKNGETHWILERLLFFYQNGE